MLQFMGSQRVRYSLVTKQQHRKTTELGKAMITAGWRELKCILCNQRGRQRMRWLDGWHHLLNGREFEQTQGDGEE